MLFVGVLVCSVQQFIDGLFNDECFEVSVFGEVCQLEFILEIWYEDVVMVWICVDIFFS